jgi:hypothetical protein
MKINHSIILICYNQESFIRRALDSILDEQVKPYEIIIGDDNSTDGTQEILREYQSKYPEIITLILHERNFGIFENMNKVTKNVNGDVVSILAGDDWFRPGLLHHMNKKIEELGLNPKSSKFMLLPDVVLHMPDGAENVMRNDENKLAKYTITGCVLRKCIHTRNTGLSRALFDHWPDYPADSKEIGPWADFVQHALNMQHCDKLIVMDCEGPVYRVGVGIASKTSMKELDQSFYNALIRLQSQYHNGELKLNQPDKKFLDFQIACWDAILHFRIAKISSLWSASWRVVVMDYSETPNVIKQLLQVVRRWLSLCKRRIVLNASEPARR